MDIGRKIKNLRLQKGLTQEELGERTDLSKGFISQLERDLNSPSIETLFLLLEVLGSSPKEFFDEPKKLGKVVYRASDQTVYTNEDLRYDIRWLIPRSNENEMDPVHITLQPGGAFKEYEPSEAETFIYVLKGKITITIGTKQFIAKEGDSVYFESLDHHQIQNASKKVSEFLLIATESYL